MRFGGECVLCSEHHWTFRMLTHLWDCCNPSLALTGWDGAGVILGCERPFTGMIYEEFTVSISEFRMSPASVCFTSAQGHVQENLLPSLSFSQTSVGPGEYRSPRVHPQNIDRGWGSAGHLAGSSDLGVCHTYNYVNM